MNCPICKHVMVEGIVSVDRAFFNALFTGFGSSNVYFKKNNSQRKFFKKRIKVLAPNRNSAAYHCEECQATLFAS